MSIRKPNVFVRATRFFTESLNKEKVVYLVKRKVDNNLLGMLGGVFGQTHWALQVGTNFYQLDLTTESKSKKDIHLSMKKIPKNKVTHRQKLGKTRASYGHVKDLAERIIQTSKDRGQHSILTNDNQNFATMLAGELRSETDARSWISSN